MPSEPTSAPGRARAYVLPPEDAPAPLPDPTCTMLQIGDRPERGEDAAWHVVDARNMALRRAGVPRAARVDGWTPLRRRRFLEALANCGSIRTAALLAEISPQSAGRLRRRDPEFAALWNAALLIASHNAEDELHDRAMFGVVEDVRNGDGVIVAQRKRYDNRLLVQLLARLDRLPADAATVAVAAEFEARMDALAPREEELAAELADAAAQLEARADSPVLAAGEGAAAGAGDEEGAPKAMPETRTPRWRRPTWRDRTRQGSVRPRKRQDL